MNKAEAAILEFADQTVKSAKSTNETLVELVTTLEQLAKLVVQNAERIDENAEHIEAIRDELTD